MSIFNKWFEEQFGARDATTSLTDEELFRRVQEGREAQIDLNLRTIWDEKYKASLYAYNIPDYTKGFEGPDGCEDIV